MPDLDKLLDQMTDEELIAAARAEEARYMRAYRASKPDKNRQIQRARYWAKKALQRMAAEEADKEVEHD